LCPEPFGLLITCEHGGNRIPPTLAHRFAAAGEALHGHRGWDPGALALASALARAFAAPLLRGETSRLVVDLNRARHSRAVFSEYTSSLGREEREVLLREHYDPFREEAREAVTRLLGGGRKALHISVHTFTPVLHGRERRTDVGLLYDPSRAQERAFCLRWQESLWRADATLRVRRNHPYRGTSDGLTTSLRKVFAPETYLGIELEVNQRHALAGDPPWGRLQKLLCWGLAEVVGACPGGPPSQEARVSRRNRT